MAGGDAAKLEKEKQKNLANEQDQSPHKDAPRWNEALAVSACGASDSPLDGARQGVVEWNVGRVDSREKEHPLLTRF